MAYLEHIRFHSIQHYLNLKNKYSFLLLFIKLLDDYFFEFETYINFFI